MSTYAQLAEMISNAYRIVMYPGTEKQLELEVYDVNDTSVEVVEIVTGEEYTVYFNEFDLTRDQFFEIVETDTVDDAIMVALDKETELEMCYSIVAVTPEGVHVTDYYGNERTVPLCEITSENSQLFRLAQYRSMSEYNMLQ